MKRAQMLTITIHAQTRARAPDFFGSDGPGEVAGLDVLHTIDAPHARCMCVSVTTNSADLT
jgi:hypothetical protein